MTQDYTSHLFNFSSSYFGGALKRILAYLKWFNERGGATFILNYQLQGIENTFPKNRYYFLKKNSISKVFNYSKKFNQYISEIENIDFYYSYGIPIPYKIGKVNWLHIANVLPFVNARKYVSFKRSIEMNLLGSLLKNSMKHATIISAESKSSLELLKQHHNKQYVISVNGSDDEIDAYKIESSHQKTSENIAVAVGTCRYKCIDDAYKIYLHLRKNNSHLKLIIAGIEKDVPSYIRKDSQVSLCGVLTQQEICTLLHKAKYYITTTLIENSYNAAAEGIFFSQESFISNIGPHRELLQNSHYQMLNHFKTRIPSLHVNRKNVDLTLLKSWDVVIREMLQNMINTHDAIF